MRYRSREIRLNIILNLWWLLLFLFYFTFVAVDEAYQYSVDTGTTKLTLNYTSTLCLLFFFSLFSFQPSTITIRILRLIWWLSDLLLYYFTILVKCPNNTQRQTSFAVAAIVDVVVTWFNKRARRRYEYETYKSAFKNVNLSLEKLIGLWPNLILYKSIVMCPHFADFFFVFSLRDFKWYT